MIKKGKLYCFVGIALFFILCFVSSTTSRPSSQTRPYQPGTHRTGSRDSAPSPLQDYRSMRTGKVREEIESEKNKVGSAPPSCEDKCFGCRPCKAIQMPTSGNGNGHMRVQYTNYVPEHWGCKCGTTLYEP